MSYQVTMAAVPGITSIQGTAIPYGCICSYTWHSACDGRIARNGPVLSCPADHESAGV